MAFIVVPLLVLPIFLFSVMKMNDAYRGALEAAKESAELREALGTPIEPGWIVTGSVNVSGSAGDARLSFDVSGPKGEATIHLEAVKRAGVWHYGLIEAELEGDGRRLDLVR